MAATFIILVLATLLFIHGKIRSDIVALGSLLLLTIFGIITPTEAIAGFSNSVVIMIAGLFVVGAGILNTGLAKQLGNRLLQLGDNNEKKLFIIILITVGIFSAFMSNTGTVAVLLPVVISMALHLKQNPSKYLMPLAFASSLGGVLTLIGTPPNLIASETIASSGYEALSFFDFTPVGLVAFSVGILFLSTIGKKLLPDKLDRNIRDNKAFSAKELAGFYKIYNDLHVLEIPPSSSIIGIPLKELKLPISHGITIISIERKAIERKPFRHGTTLTPKADTTLEANDKIIVLGDSNRLIEEFKLREVKIDNEDSALLSRTNGISEVLITPHSNVENKTIRELHFRKKHGLTVLAIQRNGKYVLNNVGKEKLHLGDSLLVHGPWEQFELLEDTSTDFVVVGQVSDQATSAAASGKAPIAGGIMILMLALMTLELLEPVITVLISALLMVVTGCVRSTKDAYQNINWESVILIAAMLPMATALEKSGGVLFLSDVLLGSLGDFGPYAVLAGFYLLTMILSQFISNTATAVIFVPIAITTAINLGVSPYPFVIAVAISASMAFSTPVASPTNALVMNAGGYSFKDFVKVGVPLQIVLTFVMIPIIPIFLPF